MTQQWLTMLQDYRAIAVIRSPSVSLGQQLAKALIAGGMRIIEITWNSDQPGQLVETLREEFPDCSIGVGTILNPTQLQDAIAAGAQFVFSPHCNPQLIQSARQAQLPIIPGALTPSEIIGAWEMGATCVKVFPIQAVGGVQYLKNLKTPLGEIPLIPTGGVTLDNAANFISNGAIAVGLASSLCPPHTLQTQNWTEITQNARILQQKIQLDNHNK
ncbi:bifunctional 4-hydroxy-2-oxoglutarate aldolase/2-dehydro-3-deoxy-phosphogluconate aldolase [Spirulina sp. CS-785/01]|uniref:bifunctional 4-hydroxy-2-oxoglutarate aldolase/2-dehydro-3-deoxy-phosphogluconate aldolase n=1 Tax=Spirulina sp. CS-785/01 TaxID=3021716 RepID=UPI002330F48D|nr:bifunctional 4-hydroxy-2-oxoglutarate aldolase/2-dehydro-3-deoxy-phosphogluconate aldolase [Spirulina sp. CS-785/01]MDB9315045.1 bifunctional 4-hydroxy-2-oxoglutarate aldolase/2-dehydro-3-deoxy-phosphogluconate aldolase [Spirulina sp. CS-785/01]